MIEETLLDGWIANPKKITPEIGQMLAEQLKRQQRNTTQIYVFTQQTFDVWDNKYGDPADTAITPEKFRNWMTEQAVNADYYVSYGKSRLMPQDKPVSNPPIISTTPPPVVTPPPPKPVKWISNQMVINAFYDAYGNDRAWEEMKLALGSEYRDRMVASDADRIATFTKLEKLPKAVNDILKP